MTCIYCQGSMNRGTAPFDVTRNGYHLSLDSVPAWVCGQCGEAYFEEAEVQHIQNMIEAVDQAMAPLTAGALAMG